MAERLYGMDKLTLTKKFAKTHALANFCNFSACWVYDMFEDLLRCYNFYRLGGYIGHPVPENEAVSRELPETLRKLLFETYRDRALDRVRLRRRRRRDILRVPNFRRR